MEPTQAQAEEKPTTAAPDPEAGNQPQPDLENASLEDLDAVQTEGARITAESKPAGGGEGEGAEVTPPTAEAAPVTTEEPPPGEETPPPAEPAAPPAEPPEPPSGEIPERFRFKDPTDRAIAAVKKAADVNGTPITWSEAERRVRGEPVAEAPAQDDPIVVTSETISTLQGEIAILEAQVNPPDDQEEKLSTKEERAAQVELAKKRAQLTKEELRLEGLQYQREGERLSAVEIQKRAREDSKNRALVEFPDAADPNTALGKAITAEFEKMKNPRHPEHPVLYADTAPEIVTERVAKRLGIAPKAKAPPPPKVVTPPAVPPKKAIPVSGNKTAVPGKPAEAKEKTFEYLRDEASLDELDDFAGANTGIAAAVR